MHKHEARHSSVDDQAVVPDWKIGIWDEQTWTEDSGRRAVVELVHQATAVTLTAHACQFDDSPHVVVEVLRDDLSLGPVVASRLVSKLFERYAPECHRDDGSVGFVTLVTLADVVDDLYAPDVGMDLKYMIRIGVQHPDVPDRPPV